MTKIWKARFKNYKTGIRYNARREKFWLTLNKLNLKIWDNLEFKKNYKKSKHPKSMDTPWRLNYKFKQEIKTYYGRISESTLKKINKKNRYNRQLLIGQFETRLDVLLFKLNWAESVFHAKQIINHGHILVNGAKLKIPSYNLKLNDTIRISSNIESRNIIKSFLKRKISRINFVNYLIYSRYIPHYMGGKNNLKGIIEHWLYLPLFLEVDYLTMTATLVFKVDNEHLLIHHPLKPFTYISGK